MAKWAWSFVSSWWNIEVKSGDARNISLKFKGPSTRVAWEITWSATMWTIWLCRNQLVFQNTRIKKNELHVLITYRSQLWCQAANLIDDRPTWKTNPIGMILSSSKKRLSSLFNANSELIGFIDGAWKISKENKIQAGIGGYLKDAKGNLILVFSGPVNASSASECEYRAIGFLINKIVSSQWRGKSCVIYSDSVEMVKDIRQSKFKMDHSEFENSKSVILLSKVEFKKVDRVLNWEADNLEKEGAMKDKMYFAWC
ncbi:hypothetical protein POM88_017432 [Heracleum sosnowskyi]|uniref:RNase H type-1 domain-containing protein n=1 Tax=Heracleum sosnowskyi TaxID=360622 RepID=A0AAD8MXY5_9APIA|nr:hypothetical protein POM88_017432 [Heracleum sosnowskyi]